MREFFIAETHSKTCSRLRKQKSLDGSKTAVWQEKCKENPRKNTDKERTFLFFSSIQYSTASHEIKAVCDSTYSCRRYPFFCSPAELGYIESRDQCSYQSGHFPIFLPTFYLSMCQKVFCHHYFATSKAPN